VLGAEVLVVGLTAWGWIVAIQLPLLREWGTMRVELRGPFVLRVVLGQVATLTLVIAGVAVLWVGPGGLYWLVAGTVFSILAALFEAWVLLVEINRQEQEGQTSPATVSTSGCEIMDADGRPCPRAKDPLGRLSLGRLCSVLLQRCYGELGEPDGATTAGGLRGVHLAVEYRTLDLQRSRLQVDISPLDR